MRKLHPPHWSIAKDKMMGNIIKNNNLSPSKGDHRGFIYTSTPILIGSVPLGGTHPIRLQSMTNTDTLDTKASVAQCIRIIEAGADFERLTAQGTREAQNLENIKKELRKAGFDTPLIADIHFNPAAAETAAKIVEKITKKTKRRKGRRNQRNSKNLQKTRFQIQQRKKTLGQIKEW